MNLNINNNQQYVSFRGMFIANKTLGFPVPITDVDAMIRRLNYANRNPARNPRNPRNPRNKSVTGRGILRYVVSTWAGPNVSPSVVGRVTDELWRSATRHEKTDYTNLSRGVNRRISKLR